jgi:AraC-like DNA-binding protein
LEVAARLSPSVLVYLRRVLGDEHGLTGVTGWSELITIVRRSPVDVLVVDPRVDGSTEIEPLYELMERYPTLPVVVYTSLAAETLRTTVTLAQRGVRHVVLRGFDDEPRRLKDLLERLPARRLGGEALESIMDRLEGAMPLLQRALMRMYESPHLIDGVESLAHAAGMTRRNLDRWLVKQELASARVLIFTARLAQAYHYLGEKGFLLEDITRKLGYASPRVFSRQVRATTGHSPSTLRERLPPDRFMEVLTAMMRRHGAKDDEAVQ